MPFTIAGVTADILDLGGLALCAIEASTGVAASLVAFSGAISSTAVAPIHNSIGGRIALGSTDGIAGKIVVIDPPILAGIRYLQVATITSTGGTVAQTTGDTIKLCLTDRR